MGRKKYREITVDQGRYGWRVTSLNQSYLLLKVQHGGGTGRPLRVRFRFDDPWLHLPEVSTGDPKLVEAVYQTVAITPFAVRKAVEAGVILGWNPASKGAPFDMVWMDGKFIEIDDAALIPDDKYDATTGLKQRPPTSQNDD